MKLTESCYTIDMFAKSNKQKKTEIIQLICSSFRFLVVRFNVYYFCYLQTLENIVSI